MCDSQHPSHPTRTPGINSNSHFVVVAHTRAKNADWNIPSIRICIFCVTGVLSWYVLVRKKKKRPGSAEVTKKKGCVTPPTRKGMKFPEGKKSINILIIPLLLVTDERRRKRKMEKLEEDKEEEDFFFEMKESEENCDFLGSFLEHFAGAGCRYTKWNTRWEK